MHLLFEQAQGLKAIAVWCFWLLVILVLLALPAYFMLLPVVERIRKEMTEYLARLKIRHMETRTGREQCLEKLANDFRNDLCLRLLNDAIRGLFHSALQQLRKNLTQLRHKLDKNTQALAKLKGPISNLHGDLSR